MPRLPGEFGMGGEDGAPRVGFVARARDAGRAIGLHQRAPVRLLLIAHLDHVDLDFEPEQRTGESERRAPLAGPGFGRELPDAGFAIVEGLRDRGVGFVAAGRADALVFVEDARRRIEGPLEPERAEERRRAPELVDLAHGPRNLDIALARDLLENQRHREDGRQIGRADRLPGSWMQHRRRRLRQVGGNIVPGARNAVLRKEILDAVAHGENTQCGEPGRGASVVEHVDASPAMRGPAAGEIAGVAGSGQGFDRPFTLSIRREFLGISKQCLRRCCTGPSLRCTCAPPGVARTAHLCPEVITRARDQSVRAPALSRRVPWA